MHGRPGRPRVGGPSVGRRRSPSTRSPGRGSRWQTPPWAATTTPSAPASTSLSGAPATLPPTPRPAWRRPLVVALHVGAFAGAVLFYGVAGLLFAFWAEALAVSLAWLLRGGSRLLAAVSLFFLFVHLQFLTSIAALEAGDPFLVFEPGFVLRGVLPAVGCGLASGVVLLLPPGRSLPSPMRKVVLLHVSLVLGGVLGGFLFFFSGQAWLVGGLLTALRIAEDLAPDAPSPWPWPRAGGAGTR